MDRFLRLVHILYESGDAVWLMVGHFLLRFLALVLENDGQLRVQISGLVKTAFHVVLLKPRFIKNGVIRQEVDNGARLLSLAHHRKQSVLQGNYGIAPLIDEAAGLDRHGQSGGQCIDHRGSHAVQAAAGLISGIVKFTPCMEGGEHQTLRADSLLMHPHRNASSVVDNRSGAVRLQHHPDGVADPRQMLVHRIVHDLIYQMIQALCGNAADVHARTFAHGLKPLQYCDAGGVIIVCRCHIGNLLP